MSNQSLVCPRCGAEMETYNRGGVEVDRCTGCRGVFLDRGELETLIDGEAAYYQQQQPPSAPAPSGYPPAYGSQPPPPPQPGYSGYYDDEHHGGHHGGHHGYSSHDRRRGFLHDLFD